MDLSFSFDFTGNWIITSLKRFLCLKSLHTLHLCTYIPDIHKWRTFNSLRFWLDKINHVTQKWSWDNFKPQFPPLSLRRNDKRGKGERAWERGCEPYSWFATDVIAAMLVTIKKRLLINSFYCLSSNMAARVFVIWISREWLQTSNSGIKVFHS